MATAEFSSEQAVSTAQVTVEAEGTSVAGLPVRVGVPGLMRPPCGVEWPDNQAEGRIVLSNTFITTPTC